MKVRPNGSIAFGVKNPAHEIEKPNLQERSTTADDVISLIDIHNEISEFNSVHLFETGVFAETNREILAQSIGVNN